MSSSQNSADKLFWAVASEIRRTLRVGGTHARQVQEIEDLLKDLREDAVNSEAAEPSQ
jgi:hypothetical protein